MRKFTLILSALLLFSYSFSQNLSNIDLSKLTPEQIEMYRKYAGSKNTSQQNSETQSTYNGERTLSSDSVNENAFSKKSKTNKQQEQFEKYMSEHGDKLPVYGQYLFSTQDLTFEPKLNIPTPVNYVLGPYDEVIVDVSGLYDASSRLKISPEGFIRIPNVGPVKVSGKTIEEAERSIRAQAAKIYPGIENGQTRINITLGNIRSIKVSIIGNVVRPGSYTLPSLATAFNALYAAGGPDENGSMRQVKVIRNGKLVAEIDLYKFLTDGVLKNNVLLHDGDVVKVDPYIARITMRGALKNIGRFEGKEGETLADMIRYAGGFTDSAYTQIATIIRTNLNNKNVVDVKASEYNIFKVKGGDDIYFSTQPEIFTNKIEISGAVNRPGVYALEKGLTVSALIKKADGLKEDAFLNMALINRKRADKVPEIINFRLGDVLSGKAPDILLHRDDKVEINSVLDQRNKQKVTISGEVKTPGVYNLVENMTVVDLIMKAKGFTEAASTDSIELIRVVKNEKELISTSQKSITMKFKIDKDLNITDSTGLFVLESGDQVVVRRIHGFESIRMVNISGEVIRPGNYNIMSKTERISELINRVGGFTNYAYLKGAFLIRNPKLDDPQKKMNRFLVNAAKTQIVNSSANKIDETLLEKLGAKSENGLADMDSIKEEIAGGGIAKEIEELEGLVGINLEEIMTNPGGKYDLILEEGDVLYIPRQLQTVRVMGEVFFPTYVRYDDNKSIRNYLSNAGGVTSNGLKKQIFVLYPNGSSASTRSFLWMKFYPKVTPGSQVLVPRKELDIAKRMTTGETISILSTVASMAALVYSIVKQ